MNDPQINESRAQMYWWLSSLFFSELTDKQLQHYLSVDFQHFIAQLSANEELQDSAEHFSNALTRLSSREDSQLELAADFCGLFLTGERSGALPYASVYLCSDKLMQGQPAQAMQARLIEHQIGIASQHNEPADHLAIILDFVGNLIINMNQQENGKQLSRHYNEQIDIIKESLLSWVPSFASQTSKNDKFGFYAAAAELLVAYLSYDLAFCIEQVNEQK